MTVRMPTVARPPWAYACALWVLCPARRVADQQDCSPHQVCPWSIPEGGPVLPRKACSLAGGFSLSGRPCLRAMASSRYVLSSQRLQNLSACPRWKRALQ